MFNELEKQQRKFAQSQVEHLDYMIAETRETIERAMVVEERLIEEKERWLQRLGSVTKGSAHLILLPSLMPESGPPNDAA